MTRRDEPAPIGAAAVEPSASPFVDTLYHEFLVRGIAQMFPGSRLETFGPAPTIEALLARGTVREDSLDFDWLGARYRLTANSERLSDDRLRLLDSIGHVLTARYRLIVNEAVAAQRLQVCALTTYENRRIATGVLLFGAGPDPCHAPPPHPPGAIRYSTEITSSRSFHRLCDGLQTLALVDGEGLLVELVDVERWVEPTADVSLAVPSPARYRAHSRATLCGGHVCLVLTPNGEIKIFAGGAQVFNFIDGRWRLTEARAKYEALRRALGDAALAERLFTAALDLAEARRGALFVVLDDASSAAQLVPSADLLTAASQTVIAEESKRRFHYLLDDKRLLEVAPAVLESVARIDGAIVLDVAGNLLAFGTILRLPRTDTGGDVAEGGRTTAALAASRLGSALMVSEDGVVSFFRAGQGVWQL
jgi:hypothetical protein